MLYNVVKKSFSDGVLQYKFYLNPIKNGYPSHKNTSNIPKLKNERSINSLLSSVKRSKNKIYDYARCQKWDYFITLTLNQKHCNRFDYDSAISIIKLFTLFCRRNNIVYLLIPEQHKNGAWHFHGLIYCDNKNVYNKMLVQSKIEGIYNIKSFKYGFTTASSIRSNERVASYITKYLTKSFGVPKGKKRYWFSRSLKRPIEKAFLVKDDELEIIINQNADYSKVLGKFQDVRFYEIHKK